MSRADAISIIQNQVPRIVQSAWTSERANQTRELEDVAMQLRRALAILNSGVDNTLEAE